MNFSMVAVRRLGSHVRLRRGNEKTLGRFDAVCGSPWWRGTSQTGAATRTPRKRWLPSTPGVCDVCPARSCSPFPRRRPLTGSRSTIWCSPPAACMAYGLRVFGDAGPGASHVKQNEPDTLFFAFQDGHELRAVSSLARCDQRRQRSLVLVAGQVNLGGPAAPGPTEPVVVRLAADPAGRLSWACLFLRAPAACWCARQIVESTFTSHVISPAASALACSPVNEPGGRSEAHPGPPRTTPPACSWSTR